MRLFVDAINVKRYAQNVKLYVYNVKL